MKIHVHIGSSIQILTETLQVVSAVALVHWKHPYWAILVAFLHLRWEEES